MDVGCRTVRPTAVGLLDSSSGLRTRGRDSTLR
jgi:hypothetical protein